MANYIEYRSFVLGACLLLASKFNDDTHRTNIKPVIEVRLLGIAVF